MFDQTDGQIEKYRRKSFTHFHYNCDHQGVEYWFHMVKKKNIQIYVVKGVYHQVFRTEKL